MADCEDLIKSAKIPREIRDELMDAIEQGDKELFDNIIKRTESSQMARKAELLDRAEVRTKLEKYHEGRPDAKAAVEDELSGRAYKSQGKGTSMDTDISSYRSRLTTQLGDFLDAVKPTLFKRKAAGRLLRSTMKAYYEGVEGLSKGAEGVAKQAEVAAKQLQQLDDLMFKMQTDAGIPVSYREKYGVPIKHDSVKIESMGEQAWIDLVTRTGMADGIVPTPTQVSKGIDRNAILAKTYKDITSHGAIPSDDILRKALGPDYRKSYMKERMLQPTTGDGMIEYMKHAGASDTIYDAMTRKIDMVSRELAATKRFGLDYEANFRWLADKTDVATKSNNTTKTARHMFDRLINKPLAGEPIVWSKILGDVRAAMVIMKLPATAITAISDKNFEMVTKLFSGYKPGIRMMRTLNRIDPSKAGTKETAKRLGLVVDDSIRYLANETDWRNMSAHKFMKSAANLSTRISGLSPWTTMMKRSAGLDVLSSLAYGKYTKKWGQTLARYGINEEEFAIMQKSITTIDGVKFVDVNLASMPEELKTKVMSMTFSEMNLMVPEMGTKAASWISGRSERGSFKEALFTTALQFKGFGVSQFFTHWTRMIDQYAQNGATSMYGPTLFIGGMFMGHVSLSLAELSKGNDPKNVFDPDGSLNGTYVWDCIDKSGLTPIIGDYFLSDPNLWGGISSKLVGPGMNTGIDAFKLVVAPLHELKDNEGTLAYDYWDKHLAKGYSFVERNVWFNRLPYTRAAWDHTLGKVIHQMIDPKYYDKQMRLNQRMSSEGRGRFIDEQRMPDINPFQ